MRAPFAREVLAQVAGDGKPVVLILDQSKVSDRHQGRMLALRYGERAVPLAWRVETTAGAIGFDTQKALLEAVAPWVPAEAKVTLMGDRFYGTADVSGGCQQRDWGYRLRLKGNLVVFEGTDKTTTGACASAKLFYLQVYLQAASCRTHPNAPANGRAPTSASSMIQVTPNRGSSPCRSGRVMSGAWRTASAGAAHRWSPTSNPAALVSRTRRSATPTASIA